MPFFNETKFVFANYKQNTKVGVIIWKMERKRL